MNPSLPATSRLGLLPNPSPARLTALEDGAVVRQAAAPLERRAVPALVAQLVLTLVDGDVQALERRRRHVGAAQAQAQLPLAQAGQRQAHGVGGQRRLARQLQAQNLIAESPANGGGRERASGAAVEASRPLRVVPPRGVLLAAAFLPGLGDRGTCSPTAQRQEQETREAPGRRPRPGPLRHDEARARRPRWANGSEPAG